MSRGLFARPRLVAIFRSATYSPLHHGANDTAILEATVSELERLGWSAHRFSERHVVTRALPPAELYLNMCQGPAASHALLEHEAMGHRFINRPSSVLGCHRHRLVPALAVSGIPVPATLLLSTEASLTRTQEAELASLGAGPFWLKRGGVHAERPEDVILLQRHELNRGLAEFATRGIPLAAVQAHVPGPVVKFYGVTGGDLFHAYVAQSGAPVTLDLVNPETLRALAFRAAARLRLDIFGGDVVIAENRRPVLVDLNDWPSFAPIRGLAARAIAGHVHAAQPRGALV
jgi:hypothetical protein